MSAKTNATVFATVASLLRQAASTLRTVKQSENNGLWGTVLGDLERIIGLCQDTEKATVKAPIQQSPAPIQATVLTADALLAAANGSLADRQAAWATFTAARPKLLTNPTLAKVKAADGASLKAGLEMAAKFLAAEKPATVQPVAPVADSKPAAETVKPAPVAAKGAATETTKHNDKPAPKAKGKPAADKGAGLAAYRQLKAKCKAMGLPTTGKADELSARIAAAESKPTTTEKPASKPESAAAYKAGTVLIADGKGGVREATEADLWAALERLNKKAA